MLAMEEIMKNPRMGTVVMRGLSDARWQGWCKMQYVKKLGDGSQIVIHFVGQFKDGGLRIVDDFKFK